MTNYSEETLALIPGDTPKEQYGNLKFMLGVLCDIAYPRRGYLEDIDRFSEKIQGRFTLEQLNQ